MDLKFDEKPDYNELRWIFQSNLLEINVAP